MAFRGLMAFRCYKELDKVEVDKLLAATHYQEEQALNHVTELKGRAFSSEGLSKKGQVINR